MEQEFTRLTSNLDVFTYQDYRDYLRDWLELARRRYGFSYQSFARRAGFRSRSFFKMILAGRRGMSDKSLAKFIPALGLKGLEREYFRALVAYNQAKNEKERNRVFHQLKALCKLAESGGRFLFDDVEVALGNVGAWKAALEKFIEELRLLENTAPTFQGKILLRFEFPLPTEGDNI